MPEAELRPNPGLALLLLPKWLTARARAMSNERGRGARFSLLAGIGLLFWAFIYTVLYKLLHADSSMSARSARFNLSYGSSAPVK